MIIKAIRAFRYVLLIGYVTAIFGQGSLRAQEDLYQILLETRNRIRQVEREIKESGGRQFSAALVGEIELVLRDLRLKLSQLNTELIEAEKNLVEKQKLASQLAQENIKFQENIVAQIEKRRQEAANSPILKKTIEALEREVNLLRASSADVDKQNKLLAANVTRLQLEKENLSRQLEGYKAPPVPVVQVAPAIKAPKTQAVAVTAKPKVPQQAQPETAITQIQPEDEAIDKNDLPYYLEGARMYMKYGAYLKALRLAEAILKVEPNNTGAKELADELNELIKDTQKN